MNWVEETVGEWHLSPEARASLQLRRQELGLPPLTGVQIEEYEEEAKRLAAGLVAS